MDLEKDRIKTLIASMIGSTSQLYKCDLSMEGLQNMIAIEINRRVEKHINNIIVGYDIDTLLALADEAEYLRDSEKKNPIPKKPKAPKGTH